MHARGPPGLARERGPLEVAKQNAFHRSEIRSETRFVHFNFGKIKKLDKFSRADEIFFFLAKKPLRVKNIFRQNIFAFWLEPKFCTLSRCYVKTILVTLTLNEKHGGC